ncbi:TPA: hypothetical protein ACJSTK_001924 [Streptococcus agalactiae]
MSSSTLTTALFSASLDLSVDLMLTLISLDAGAGFVTEPSLLITPVTVTL